jgi:exopolyphosphatase/pppGpp-phosphohydrolase
MGYPIKKIHNYTMDARLVQDVTTEMLSQDTSTLARMYEIGSGRADIIKAGAIVVEGIMERFGFGRICTSSTGLREGVLAFAVRYPEFRPHEISYYTVRELVRAPSWTPRIPHVAAGAVQAICLSGLLSGEEATILRAAAANLEWLRTFRDADDFLYRTLDNTSALSHREQLLYALCLSHAKKPKRTRLLMRRYEPLLRPGDRRMIRRLSPILLLCDTIITAGAGMDVTLGNGRVLLDVREGERALPNTILHQRCQRVGEALGVAVECSR